MLDKKAALASWGPWPLCPLNPLMIATFRGAKNMTHYKAIALPH